jgi:acyl-coenzyme A synthetase/AMP-(fatty) acid ligase
MHHPAVSLVAVIGAEELGLTRVKAFVVLRDEARLLARTDEEQATLAAALKVFVGERLSRHKAPRWVVIAPDLPKNDRGKVDKKTLKAREARGENPRGM